VYYKPSDSEINRYPCDLIAVRGEGMAGANQVISLSLCIFTSLLTREKDDSEEDRSNKTQTRTEVLSYEKR
jgi:hypothetical protein